LSIQSESTNSCTSRNTPRKPSVVDGVKAPGLQSVGQGAFGAMRRSPRERCPHKETAQRGLLVAFHIGQDTRDVIA
jgi:hypothetical protein